MALRWKSYTFFDKHECNINLPENVTAFDTCTEEDGFAPYLSQTSVDHRREVSLSLSDKHAAKGHQHGKILEVEERDFSRIKDAQGGGLTWLGTEDGVLACMSCTPLSLVTTFPAFKGKILCLTTGNGGRLFALGENTEGEGMKGLMLKIWAPKSLFAGANPSASVALKLFGSNKVPEASITAAAISSAQWPIVSVALGTSQGLVHVYRGDVLKHKISEPYSNIALHPGQSDQVNHLHFALDNVNQEYLFIVADSCIKAVDICTGQAVLHDNHGAASGCSTVNSRGELMLCNNDSIEFYTVSEGRKAALAIRGRKTQVAVFHHYIGICMGQENLGSVSNEKDVSYGESQEKNVDFTLYDYKNKVIGASASFAKDDIKWIAPLKTGVIIVYGAGEALFFQERTLQQKLDILFKLRAFQLALKIAETENAPGKVMTSIHRRYGDYLYSKRDFDGATEHYIATIGALEPSHVIQRLLEPQNSSNLILYLEALHDHGVASADHTTILLTSYARIKDQKSIEHFLERIKNQDSPFSFDPSAAVSALRMAGYPEMVMAAAEFSKAINPSLYLEVLINDCQRSDLALEFLRSLERKEAADGLQKHGKKLVDMDAISTTALLMELCLPVSGPRNSPSTSSSSQLDQDTMYVANFASFTHLFAERPNDLQYACVTILAMGEAEMDSDSRMSLYHTLLELYLINTSANRSSSSEELYSKMDQNMEDFSRGIADDKKEINYLAETNKSFEDEAMDLLQRGWPPGEDPAYDASRALTICRTHNFTDGLVFLYTSLRMFREAGAILANAKEWDRLLQLCNVHGNALTGGDPEVWRDALERLSSVAAGPTAIEHLERLISQIESNNILPPLMLLPILARNPYLKLSLVREYTMRALSEENRAISAANDEIEKLQEEIEKSEKTIHRLKTDPLVFQASRDAQTGAALELPSVHFMCGHSFNLRTLGDVEEDSEMECPLCQTEHRRLRDVQRSHMAAAADPDTFYKQLKGAAEGFEVIAEYFGKGILNSRSKIHSRDPI